MITCGATDWVPCDDGKAHVNRVCTLPAGHYGRWHRELKDGALWAESSGDRGPIPPQRCVHTPKVGTFTPDPEAGPKWCHVCDRTYRFHDPDGSCWTVEQFATWYKHVTGLVLGEL